MAVTNQLSTQLTNSAAGVANPAYAGKAAVYLLFFDVPSTVIGDANSTIELVDIPGGKSKYLSYLSRLYASAFGTGRTMDIGWRAYINEEGATVAADEDGIHSALDVAAAGTGVSVGDELTNGMLLFSVQTTCRIVAKVEAAALGAGETINGWFGFAC